MKKEKMIIRMNGLAVTVKLNIGERE